MPSAESPPASQAKKPDADSAKHVRPAFSMLGGLLAWFFSFMALFALSEIACNSDVFAVTLLGVPATVFVGLGLTLAASFTALASAHVAMKNDSGAGGHDDDRPFLARAGALLGGYFVVVIIAGGLPFLLLRTCG